MEPQTITLEKDQFLCRSGDEDRDMYQIQKGKMLVFVLKGSQVTPLAELEKGEYVGELSYFDHQPKSAFVVATEKTVLSKMPSDLLEKHFPPWLKTLAVHMTKKLRSTDELIRKKGIKKKNVEGIKPLSIEEQSHYFKLTKS